MVIMNGDHILIPPYQRRGRALIMTIMALNMAPIMALIMTVMAPIMAPIIGNFILIPLMFNGNNGNGLDLQMTYTTPHNTTPHHPAMTSPLLFSSLLFSSLKLTEPIQ